MARGASGTPVGSRYAARSMALDPRTPVVVGRRPGDDAGRRRAGAAVDRPEPLELMTAALRAAAEDCDGAAPGGSAPAGYALLRRADSVRVVAPLGWHAVNPALAVASALGVRAGVGAAPADGLGRRRQLAAGADARRLPRHRPRRPRRGPGDRRRGHVRPRAGAARPGQAVARVGVPAGRRRRRPMVFGVDKPGATRARDEPRA